MVQLTYMFGVDLQIYEVEKLVDVSHSTVVDWYQFLRSVCRQALQDDPIFLGNSTGSIVEID